LRVGRLALSTRGNVTLGAAENRICGGIAQQLFELCARKLSSAGLGDRPKHDNPHDRWQTEATTGMTPGGPKRNNRHDTWQTDAR
jgi:hypothetical protein